MVEKKPRGEALGMMAAGCWCGPAGGVSDVLDLHKEGVVISRIIHLVIVVSRRQFILIGQMVWVVIVTSRWGFVLYGNRNASVDVKWGRCFIC